MSPVKENHLSKPLNSPNDVVVKRWIDLVHRSCVRHSRQLRRQSGRVRKISRRSIVDGETGEAIVIADDILGPNGLCFSPDESILYIVESRGEPYRKILAYDVNADGKSITNKRISTLVPAGRRTACAVISTAIFGAAGAWVRKGSMVS